MSGIRATQLVNFKGDKYITEPEVDAKISAATGGATGLIDEETGNLRYDLNPIHITSIEKQTPSTPESEDKTDQDFSNIQFIGDCKVFYKGNGKIVIRIGENLNSSNWNTEDGQTNATGSITIPNSTAAKLPDGTSVNLLKNTGSYTVSTTGGSLIHFPDNEGTKFEVVVNDAGTSKTYYFGPITGNNTYSAYDAEENGSVVSGVTMSVTNFDVETRTADGATGYCGNVSFTISANTIAGGDSSAISVTSVKCINSEGEFTYTPSNTGRYFETDTTTKPTLTSVDCTVSATGYKQESGVTYITGGTVAVTAAGDNFKTPAYVDNAAGTIVPVSSTWFTSSTTIQGSNLTSDEAMSKTGIAVQNGKFATCDAKVTMTNINGSSTAVESARDYKVLQYTSTGSINEASNRKTSTFTAWTPANALGSSDLQVYNGCIQYPSEDFTGYNADVTITGNPTFTQPNYSGSTGDRYIYFKLNCSGTQNNGQITLVSVASITSFLQADTLKVEIAKDSAMTTLYNVAFNSPTNDIGDSNSTFGTTSVLKYTFKDGPANDSVWLRITMKPACTAKIKSIAFKVGENNGTLA